MAHQNYLPVRGVVGLCSRPGGMFAFYTHRASSRIDRYCTWVSGERTRDVTSDTELPPVQILRRARGEVQ